MRLVTADLNPRIMAPMVCDGERSFDDWGRVGAYCNTPLLLRIRDVYIGGKIGFFAEGPPVERW